MTDSTPPHHRDATETTSLSPDGELRRSSMLDELLHAQQQHHRTRTRRRHAAFATLGMIAIVSGLAVMWPRTATGPVGTHDDRTSAHGDTTTTHDHDVSRHMVTTDPSTRTAIRETDTRVLDRYAISTRNVDAMVVQTSAVHVSRIDDDELVDALASVSPEAGLIRFGGQTILTGLPDDDAADPEVTPPATSPTESSLPNRRATTT